MDNNYLGENNFFSLYHLRCDLTRETGEPVLAFNYHRFNAYVKKKFEIEKRSRELDTLNGTISPGLDYFTDDRLKDELFEIYGGMDETSQRFQVLFKSYKEQRLEQLQEWIAVENKLYEENKSINPTQLMPGSFPNENEQLRIFFTSEELACFQSVAGQCETEPFLLPRPKQPTDEPLQTSNISNKQLNKSQAIKKNHPQKQDSTLVSEVLKVLRDHPLGLTGDQLLKICDKKFQTMNTNRRLVLQPHMLETDPLNSLLSTIPYMDGHLVFQAGLPGRVISNPTSILWHVKHKLLAVLNLCDGIVEASKLVNICFDIFQITHFRFGDWSFENEAGFVKWLFNKWKSTNVEVFERKPKFTQKSQFYLAVMSEERRQLIEQMKSTQESSKPTASQYDSTTDAFLSGEGNPLKSKQKKQQLRTTKTSSTMPIQQISKLRISESPQPSISGPSPSPWNKVVQAKYDNLEPKPSSSAILVDPKFVQPGDKIIRECDTMHRNTEVVCVVAYIESPTSIYLVRETKWNELQKLFSPLKDYWKSAARTSPPHPQILQSQLMCLAKVPDDNDEDEFEVYRVVIVEERQSDHQYRAFCIDFGETFWVDHNNLRYMPREYLTTIDAQTISCQLYNVASSKKDASGKNLWSQDVNEFTMNLMLPTNTELPTMKALFKQREQATGQWLIKASNPPACLDVGEEVMKFVNRQK